MLQLRAPVDGSTSTRIDERVHAALFGCLATYTGGLLGQLSRVSVEYSADAAGDLPASFVIKLASTSAANLGLCEAIRLYWREHQCSRTVARPRRIAFAIR